MMKYEVEFCRITQQNIPLCCGKLISQQFVVDCRCSDLYKSRRGSVPSLCSHSWRLFKSSSSGCTESFTGDLDSVNSYGCERQFVTVGSPVLSSSSQDLPCHDDQTQTKYHAGESSQVLLLRRGIRGQFCASNHPLPLRTARFNREE